ncbi:hypothetical protein FS837_001039 [Tulasnella sp. UAMH 9824]|nr:hypothetical protein FS837_001039 [Tulasnella sp. UAMH 9824]
MSSHPSSSGSDVNTLRDFRRLVDGILQTIVILEPKDPGSSSTKAIVERLVRRVDKGATITNDPKSANFWILANDVDAADRLIKKDSIIKQFTPRQVVIVQGGRESGEVSRLRDFVVKNLLSESTITDPAKSTTTSASLRKTPRGELEDIPEASGSSTQRSPSSGLRQGQDDIENDTRALPTPTSAERTDSSDDAAVERTPRSPSPTPSTSESEVFYSAKSSFSEDLIPQVVEGPVGLASSTPADLPPPAKRVKFTSNSASDRVTPPASPPRSSSLPGSFVHDSSVEEIQSSKSFVDLPLEVQESILQLLLPTVPRAHEIEPGYTSSVIKSRYRHIYTLTSVCQEWKSSIEALPKLWTHIANCMPRDVVCMHIARSKGEGLKIAFLASVDRWDGVDEEIQALKTFMKMVAPFRPWWTSLVIVDIHAGGGISPLQDLFDIPAPSLREIFIGTKNNAHLSTWKPLKFKIGAPNLRILCVHGATPDLGDYPFSRQLERLHLVNPAWINTITLIGTLAINHTIRDLKLVNIKLALGEDRLKQDIEVFDLPRLESFTLSTLSTSSEFGQLFTRLKAPNCWKYDISVDLDQLASSKIKSEAVATTIEWNLLGFGLQQFLDILRDRIVCGFVYPEGERQWFDWKEARGAEPIFEWKSGWFADGVTEGRSFRIRFRTGDFERVNNWVELVEQQADRYRTMVERRGGGGSHRKETKGRLAN